MRGRQIFQFLFLIGIFLSTRVAVAADANELREPPLFSSTNGLLDLLMIARPASVSFDNMRATAWVYEVCPRSSAANDNCPADRAVSAYGGVRLQLQPGDDLKIRLINRLPPAPPDAIYAQADPAMLAANPTNLHTHGMIVSPHRADKHNPTYGDYVYVLEYPSGELPKMKMSGMDTVAAPIQYDIHVPSDHPSGLYWFHPHAHGLSLNQVAHGLGGIITVGAVSDYVQLYGQHVRHLILKDMQIRKDGSVLSQEDARFCTTFPFPSEPVRNGFCPGTLQPTGADYRGGNWFFSVNGQIFPTITVGDHGDIWRITNASGSATYLLKLIDDATRKPIPFRVVATDGVSTAIPMGMPIPGAPAASTPKACEDQETSGRDSICTTQLLVMPSSRVEVFVPSHFGSAKTATLIQASYGTGPGGDSWPTVKLAKVVFSSTPVTQASEQSVVPKVTSWKAPIDEPHQAVVKTASATPGTGDASCSALAPGHRRRIFFGIPKNSLHGLGYEEVDEKGNPVPGTFRDIVPFEHGSTTVCLPLGPGGTPVTETWELINVSSEDHNFHMHQSRFRVISDAGGGDSNLYMDSIPLPHGSWGCTGTVQRWRSGACTVKPVVVAIRFTEAGDFAYHCHILSHGDAGMMAHIRVVTAEGKTASSDSQHSGK